ncbi:unnamed protein product [Dicrocoelium dendriticum]|nr:unnamed protein product [Dicrocoelium dendriticum]
MDLSTWRARMDTYLIPVPAESKGRYVLSFLDDKVRDVLTAIGFPPDADAEAVWSDLVRLFPHAGTFGRTAPVLNKNSESGRVASNAFPTRSAIIRGEFVLERFVERITDLATPRRFARKLPLSIEDAVLIAREYAAAARIPEKPNSVECMFLATERSRLHPPPARQHLDAISRADPVRAATTVNRASPDRYGTHDTTYNSRLPTWVRTLLTPVEDVIPSTAFRRLHQLIRSKEAAFAWEGSLPGRANTICHQIDTGMAEPITKRPRRVPTQYREELRKMIEDRLDAKIIILSKSPWSSLTVLVKKKNGSLRLCIDYRKLNDVTRKDSFPLPRIDDTLEALSGAQWFSTLDLASGYWQVEIDPKDREKTAFIIPSGLYEFQTMPFGLTNAPATFLRLIENCI